MPSSYASRAVNFRASAAFSPFELSRYRIAAQDSGEITEYQLY